MHWDIRRCIAWGWLGVVVISFASTLTVASPPTVRFYGDKTIAEIGRTRVIAFELASPAASDMTLTATVEPTGIVEIVRQPQVLKGKRIGYLRVRGVEQSTGAAPSETSLTISGAKLDIQLVAPNTVRHDAPSIVGPTDGAAAWGTFTVGANMYCNIEDAAKHIALRLPDGNTIAPTSVTSLEFGPIRHITFEVNAGNYTPGSHAFDLLLNSRPVDRVNLTLLGETPTDLIAGEAEAEYDVPPLRGDDNDRHGRHLGSDKNASGGKYLAAFASAQMLRVPVEAKQAGRYQVMLRVSGNMAGGALPSVAIIHSEDTGDMDAAVTNGRTLSESFHRAAIGRPFHLDQGKHILAMRFSNDFFVEDMADRNLNFDKFEIARVPDASELTATANAAATSQPATQPTSQPTSQPAATQPAHVAVANGHLPPTDPLGDDILALRVAFQRPIDGRPIRGMLRVEGHAHYPERETEEKGGFKAAGTGAPLITLLINGNPIAEMRGRRFDMRVASAHFLPGSNTIQLTAETESGQQAASTVAHVTYPINPESHHPKPLAFARFDMTHPAWQTSLDTNALKQIENTTTLGVPAGTFKNNTAELTLPDEWAGRVMMFAEAVGDHKHGQPRAHVTLLVGEDEKQIYDGHVDEQLNAHWLDEPFDLPAGPKTIRIAFASKRWKVGDVIRLRAVGFAQFPDTQDETPPQVELHYPAEGQEVFSTDAVVITTLDNETTQWAELLVDGRQTGVTVGLAGRTGYAVLPLIMRDMDPGTYTIAVRVFDDSRNSMTSTTRRIRVLGEQPDTPTQYGRALRLLNRFAYGPDDQQLARLLIVGPHAWLDEQLTAPLHAPALAPTLIYFRNGRDQYSTTGRALMHTMLTRNPARTRLVLWTQNHFSTWIRKVDERKWPEYAAFLKMGPGRFADLLHASATSASMLHYLDQTESYAGRINENYAREIMELHTLGVHGGYTQQDVTQLAHILTGWTNSREGDGFGEGNRAVTYNFRFDPTLSEGDTAEVFGMRFDKASREERFDRAQLAMEMLAAHPSTATYISQKLAQHYVSMQPSESLITKLTATYLETYGDLRAMLHVIADDESLYDSQSDRIAQPFEYAMRFNRVLRHAHPWQVTEYLKRSGAGLFDRPTPDGYPEEDQAYLDSNNMLQRWRLAEESVDPMMWQVPWSLKHGYRNMPDEEWRQRVVDWIAWRITGRLLTEESNTAATGLLAQTKGEREQRIRAAAGFMMRLPEMNIK